MKPFEFVDHTADLQIRVHGKSLEDIFRNALAGLFSAMRARTSREKIDRRFKVRGSDREDLLVNFLNEVLADADIHRENYDKIVFETLTERRLSAGLSGFRITDPGRQIKGATYHDLFIRADKGGFEANIVFDV